MNEKGNKQRQEEDEREGGGIKEGMKMKTRKKKRQTTTTTKTRGKGRNVITSDSMYLFNRIKYHQYEDRYLEVECELRALLSVRGEAISYKLPTYQCNDIYRMVRQSISEVRNIHGIYFRNHSHDSNELQ